MKYDESDFEKDLKQLEEQILDNKKGGAKKITKKSSSKKTSTKKGKKTTKMGKKVMKKMTVMKKGKKVMKKKTVMKKRKTMKGGKSNKAKNYRHFKVVEVNGKKVDFGAIKINELRTPLSAARKAFSAIMEHMNVKRGNRPGFKATFSIYETTRGSKNKVYGPYNGRYHKYTEEEKRKAKAGKQTFEGKPVVKLMKQKRNEQKGGK